MSLALRWQRWCVRAALAVGRHDRALARLDTLLERWPDCAPALASRGHLRAQRGQFALSIADLRRLVELHPARAAADWFNLGFVLDAARHDDDAACAFRRAVELDARLDRAWYGLALVLIRQQRFDEAAAALERNTALQPMSPYGWYQLAHLHARCARADHARDIIRRLMGFEPAVARRLMRETGLAP
jgi:tetratricopeptide (TPR) repeat protein